METTTSISRERGPVRSPPPWVLELVFSKDLEQMLTRRIELISRIGATLRSDGGPR